MATRSKQQTCKECGQLTPPHTETDVPTPRFYHGDLVSIEFGKGHNVLGRDSRTSRRLDASFTYANRNEDSYRVLAVSGPGTGDSYTRLGSELTLKSSAAYRKLLTLEA